MKNLLKLTLIAAGVTICSGAFAQEVSRTAPTATTAPTAPTAVKQDSIKKDGKAAPMAPATKTDVAAPKGGATTPPTGTKMAINEQGVPSKTASPKQKTPETPATPEAPKKKE
jgi:hypothetical protein